MHPGVDDTDEALRQLSLELHATLERLDPARLRSHSRAAAREAVRSLAVRASAVRDRLATATTATRPALVAACDDLVAADADADAGKDLPAVRDRLTAAYDALGRALAKRTIATPRNRPTNYLRNLYHVGNGVAILLLIEVLVDRTGMLAVATGFAASAWSCEFLRRRSPVINRLVMRLLGTVAHPDEHWTINSATWMTTALLIVATLCPLAASAVAVAVLGFADPAAALIGRRFGSLRLRGSRTLEGTLAFFGVGTAAAAAALTLWHPALGVHALWVAAAGALPAALAELFAGDLRVGSVTLHIDDNFAIPVAAAAGATAALALLG